MRILIYGEPETEHLRAEVENGEVTLVAQEQRAPGMIWPHNAYHLYRERHLCTIPAAIWLSIAEGLKDQ